MATRKRRKKNRSGLKILIGVLAVILAALLIAAAALSGSQPDDPTPQSDPTQPSDPAGSSTASTPAADPGETIPSDPIITGWLEENGNRYYYDENGILSTGAVAIGDAIYVFGQDGALLSEGWQTAGGSSYYLNADGSAYIGWLELDGEIYYLRSDGTMARGAEEIEGTTWYFTSSGCRIYVTNPWNYLPEGYAPDLVSISTDISKEDSKVDASCYDALMRMMNDCAKAGHSVYIISSYRTQEYQEYLFNRQVDKQLANGYSREEAERVAATISAIPGTSEHQLGLAVDIIDTQIWDLVEEQEDLAGQQWLMEHCWEYGFILRYPKDKISVTGVIYEPWHYRYVGNAVAAELHGSGLTLEEYLESLS